jgi:N utilization substance protein A
VTVSLNEFKDRVGEVVNGTVKRVEYGNVIVDLGRAEGIIRRDDGSRAKLPPNDRVRAYVYEVSPRAARPADLPVAHAPEFMVKLFTMEVPEIYDGVIEIKACARDPGSRAKIGVISNDSAPSIRSAPASVCAAAACRRLSANCRARRSTSSRGAYDDATFIVNALQPAEVAKVVLDEEERRIEVVVPDDQLSLAIGRRGQNVRLASQLTGWEIDILTEEEESQRRQKEFNERTQLFMEALDVDEMVGQVLASEGFSQVEEVAYVDLGEITAIEGFDEETANELQTRAREYLDKVEAELDAKRKELGVEDELRSIPGITTPMMVALGGDGIKTVEDFAGCAVDDLTGWSERKDGETKRFDGLFTGLDVSRAEAEQMILQARLAVGWITEDELVAEEEEAGEAEVEAGEEEA